MADCFAWRWRLPVALVLIMTSAAALAQTTNQLPNPQFRGTNGNVSTFNATVSGQVPTLWRAFATDGADLSSEIVPLAADELFPGSPPTNAVRITVNAFGGDQGFDNSAVRFSLLDGVSYSANVYLRSDNPDASDQGVLVSLAVFDEAGIFTGRAPNFEPTATNTWTRFEGAAFTETGNTSAEMSFRLDGDGGDDSVLIALPEVLGPELGNLVPNPELTGAGGAVVGSVNGAVPDLWRGFAVGGGDITLATVPVAADELFPGSPATNAVQLTVNSLGTDQGIDHEASLFPIQPRGRSLWGEIYVRSANADSSPQPFGVGLNLFDAVGLVDFGVILGTATSSEWGYFGSLSVVAPGATTGDLAIRLTESGLGSLLIALPTVNGIPDEMFDDSFEEPPIPPPG